MQIDNSSNANVISPNSVSQTVQVSETVRPLITPPDSNQELSNQNSAISRQKSSNSKLDSLLDWAFRIGLSTVFLINSVTSLVKPATFRSLLETNFISHAIGHYQVLLYIIAVNDYAVGIFLLLGVKRKYVYAWAGVWLAIVTFIKATSIF